MFCFSHLIQARDMRSTICESTNLQGYNYHDHLDRFAESWELSFSTIAVALGIDRVDCSSLSGRSATIIRLQPVPDFHEVGKRTGLHFGHHVCALRFHGAFGGAQMICHFLV